MTVGENEDGDREQELDRLENIDSVTCPSTVNSEKAVGVTLHGIFVGVHGHENLPELESRAAVVSESLQNR